MKTIVTFISTMMISFNLIGQIQNPNCQHLTVENIHMDNDTANLVKITIKNNCSTCASGINGCVYLELQVIKTISPFDTIASSHCWCKWTPNNNSQVIYSIPSTVASLPPINAIRVSLLANVCGCDTIPFSSVLTGLSNEILNSLSVFPNPTNDFISVSTNGDANKLTLKVTDAHGKICKREKLLSNNETVNISELAKGLYIVEIIDTTSATIKTLKVIKD